MNMAGGVCEKCGKDLYGSDCPDCDEEDFDGFASVQIIEVASMPFSNPALPEIRLKNESDLKTLSELFNKPIFKIENIQVFDPRYPNGEIPLTKKHSTLAVIHESILYKYIYNIEGGKTDEKGKDK
jgi:hypothetical protein